MYVKIDELKTHCYEVELKSIIQNDETIALTSLEVAEEMVKSKLMKDYDVAKIFSSEGDKRNALLVKFIKDIAMWELITLASPSIDYEDKKFRYQEAVGWLTAVYKGMPVNLPKLDESKKGVKSFSYHSQPPRKNYY